MIHHVSIPAHNPRRVAAVLAQLIGGRSYPFTGPLKRAWMAVSGDRHGTMIEVYPEGTVMAAGQGDAPVVYDTQADDGRFLPFHLLLAVPHDRQTVQSIGEAAGWRTRFFSRAAPGRPPAFHVIEVWVENRVLIEVVTPDMVGIYADYMQFDRLDTLPA
jgi:hypothetical protein